MSEERISRREALVKSAAVIGGAALAARASHGAAKKKAKAMRFGFTTYTWGKPWDIPTLIENCVKAKTFGVELRTSQEYAHGVELAIGAAQRAEVKKRFADSPVTLVGLASGERFDNPDPAVVAKAIEAAKAHVKLSHDIGASGVRVFPNDFHPDVPREKTIAQIAKALNEVGRYAKELGQQVRLEAHGKAGELPTLRAIMDLVTEPAVRVKLNSDKRDALGKGFEHNFNLVKKLLGDTLHAHDFTSEDFPNQQQVTLLHKAGWTGWLLLETSAKIDDRVQGVIDQRKAFERLLKNALKA